MIRKLNNVNVLSMHVSEHLQAYSTALLFHRENKCKHWDGITYLDILNVEREEILDRTNESIVNTLMLPFC